jgi:hypothetical protein
MESSMHAMREADGRRLALAEGVAKLLRELEQLGDVGVGPGVIWGPGYEIRRTGGQWTARG